MPDKQGTSVLHLVISPKSENRETYFSFVTDLMIPMKFNWHKKRLCWCNIILHGACPCLPRMVFSMKHAPVYLQYYFAWSMPLLTLYGIFHESCPCLPPILFCMEHALAYTYCIFHESCPCLPPIVFFMKHSIVYPQYYFAWHMPLLTLIVFHMKHALVNPQ